MRLLRVYIDGYRNLKNVEVSFDKDSLTTVVIGQNGSGKSNLIEAIVEVFRAHDFGEQAQLKFRYELVYETTGYDVIISNRGGPDERPPEFIREPVKTGKNEIKLDTRKFIDSRTNAIKSFHLPDLIFGYYSGSSKRLERLFDGHQSRYYSTINKERTDAEYADASKARRLFYCRPIHGVLALLAYFAKSSGEGDVKNMLSNDLKITGFHSALAHFKEPSWFNPGNWQKGRADDQGQAGRGRRTHDKLGEQAWDIWGARGPAGECARTLRDVGFHPLTLAGKVVDDYRKKPRTEAQLACFLRDQGQLKKFAANYESDKDMFAALEAADISDLFREMIVWVTRKGEKSDDISFSDLSDGERQLFMVLGLIRVSRGKEALFLLDEPDTHLNPAWQLTYLDLIKQWTEIAADGDKCQIIMTSHNPLTIAALCKQEVRVMQMTEAGNISVDEPYVDPRGMGFTATLTEIFGLPSTLDIETQRQIDDRNVLARIKQRTDDQEKRLIEINDKLSRLGFMNESREPLYQDFLQAWQDVRYADRPPLTPEQIEARHNAMRDLIKQLSSAGTAH